MNNHIILGAYAGDVIGSIYEFNSIKTTDFQLFDDLMTFTDDSVMTAAVADWLMTDPTFSGEKLASIMRTWGKKFPYPMGGYGGRFKQWLKDEDMEAYGSWGNGSAMRVAACGALFDTLDDTLEAARRSAIVTHNHEEGVKGAQATAAAIFLARNGESKEGIKTYIETTFGYDMSKTCDEIRPSYCFDESCQGTVPQAITAFLESKDFEEALRLVVSLGGDADTMGAIAGAIAAAFYGNVPSDITKFVMNKIPEQFIAVLVCVGLSPALKIKE